MPCLNFMSGMAGVDSSICDSADLADNTTNIESESQIAQLKKQVKNLNDKNLQLTFEIQKPFIYSKRNIECIKTEIDNLKTENVLLTCKAKKSTKEIWTEKQTFQFKTKWARQHFHQPINENDENCRHYTGLPSVEMPNSIYEY